MIEWRSLSGLSENHSPYHNDPELELVSSPYYATGFYTYRKKEKPKESKQELWKCHYCQGTNFDEVVKCEHCNAPRHTTIQKQKASVWGMKPIDIPDGKPYYTVQDKMQEMTNEVEKPKTNLGESILQPFLWLGKQIRKVANGFSTSLNSHSHV